jgi:asparagine N-glycosylation enzyme membrane subunit Stt3
LLSALAAWAVSFMGLYALRGRLFLFAVPIVLMFAAGLVEFLQERKIKTIDWLAAVSLIGVVLFSAIRFFGVPPAFSEIRSVLPHLASESIPGETRVAVSQWSMFAYEYYEPRFALQYLGQPYIIPHNFNMQEFLSTICADTDRGKVWLVFSHRMNEAHAFLNILREKTPELQNFESAGAGIYLFDFSEPGVCPDP